MGLKSIIKAVTYRSGQPKSTPARAARGLEVLKNRTVPVQDVSRRGKK